MRSVSKPTSGSALADLGVARLQRAYFEQGLSVVEVAQSCLERARGEPERGAWISFVDEESLLGRARELDVLRELCPERARRLPLFGVPFSVKDNIDVLGLETTAACPAFAYRATASADCVALTLAAGGVLVGKNNLDQFATGLVGTRSPYGVCHNAFDDRYISGGSSSGSAVAVAAGQVSFSLGTDTAGSGRVPAGLNNVFGFKPSVGAVSTRGVLPACFSLDCVSVFAGDASDATTVFEVLKSERRDPFPTAAPPDVRRGFRFGVPKELSSHVDEDAKRLFEDVARLLRELGGEPVELAFDELERAGDLVYSGPFVVERKLALGAFMKEHPDACLDEIHQALGAADRFDAMGVVEAQRELFDLVRRTRITWQRVDVLVVPTVPTEYTIEQVAGDPLSLNDRLGVYTRFVNPLGLCAMAVPFAIKANGIPFGFCLVGPAGSDRAQASLARRAEAELGLAPGVAAAGRPRRVASEEDAEAPPSTTRTGRR